jgi:Fic-DOC domain mobile mystery protein B
MVGPSMPEDQPVTKVLFGDLRPGETPIDDFAGLIPDILTLSELADHEAVNIAKALVDYLRKNKPEKRKRIDFDLAGAKSLHGDMFCDVWKWAGQFRQSDINIPFASKFVRIQDDLHNLLEDLKVWQVDGDAIEQAAWLHHRAVQIHPFLNGNGRWSRLLTNIWLLEKQKTDIDWPKDLAHVSPLRSEYIKALKAADNGDHDPLVELHRRFTPIPSRPVF